MGISPRVPSERWTSFARTAPTHGSSRSPTTSPASSVVCTRSRDISGASSTTTQELPDVRDGDPRKGDSSDVIRRNESEPNSQPPPLTLDGEIVPDSEQPCQPRDQTQKMEPRHVAHIGDPRHADDLDAHVYDEQEGDRLRRQNR